MAILWADSAGKHDIDRADALHAIAEYVYRISEFDEPRVGGRRRPDLFIGPTRDGSQLLEVFAELTPPATVFIFHVMPARQKIIDRAEGASG